MCHVWFCALQMQNPCVRQNTFHAVGPLQVCRGLAAPCTTKIVANAIHAPEPATPNNPYYDSVPLLLLSQVTLSRTEALLLSCFCLRGERAAAGRLHKLSDTVPRLEYLRLDLPLLLAVASLMAFCLAVFLSVEHSVSMLINTHG